jgi:hypothetical protein
MMETLLLELEEELRAAAQAAVQAVLARARQEVEQVLEAARREREAGLREVARLRVELAAEAAAMEQLQAAQRSRIELEVGGARFVTSVATLRSRPGSMLDAMYSGTPRLWLR